MTTKDIHCNPSKLDTELDLELKKRITVLQPFVVLVKEVPKMTLETVNGLFMHLSNTIKQWETCIVIVNLEELKSPPPPELRSRLSELISNLPTKINQFIIVTGKNILLYAAAKFVVGKAIPLPLLHVVKTSEEAMKLIKNTKSD